MVVRGEKVELNVVSDDVRNEQIRCILTVGTLTSAEA